MGNRYIEASRVYHDLTKHSYTSVRSAPHFLDWDNRPMPYKIYPDAGVLALPRDLDLPTTPTLEAVNAAAEPDPNRVLDISALTRILFCAGGLTRRKQIGGEDYHFRAAASAGALYPIELYLGASDVDEVEAGLYHFSPADLKLRGLRRGDWRALLARASAMSQPIREARAILILSAIFWRSAWKYRARAYRYCFWDAGTILANLFAASAAEGISARAITAFSDPEIEKLIGADPDREGAICIVALGATDKPAGESPEVDAIRFESIRLSNEEVVYPELVKMHRESRLETPEEAREAASAPVEQAPAVPSGELFSCETIEAASALGLGETILRRGSTRAFAQEAIGAGELTSILATDHPQVDFAALTETYLIVNAVDGLDPGAYHFRRELRAFELLKRGEFRGEAGYLCLEQPLGQDCAALIVYMADLERALRALGNRGYRDAHLEAGILAGRAYLAAYSLERGATGLTFYDDDTTKFFEPRAAGKSPLLMLAVGVPRSKASSPAQ